MSRVSWKFTWATEDDLFYFYKQIDPTFQFYFVPFRHTTVNNLNNNQEYSLYQGKYLVNIYTDKFCLNRKLGMFTKTRKPFFFRSKKKKR